MGKKWKNDEPAKPQERPNPPQPKPTVNQLTGESQVEEEPGDAEKWTRFGVGLVHTVGSAVVGAYAGKEAGQFVYKEVGKLENEGLDKAFEKEKKNAQ